MKLFVYEPSGIIKIGQTNGSDRLIERYEEMGDAAIMPKRVPAGIPIDRIFVEKNRLRRRPQLNARISKTVIRADGEDIATIRGVPCGALVRVDTSDGENVFEHTKEDDGAPVCIRGRYPATYIVTIEAPPHLPQTFTIRAIA